MLAMSSDDDHDRVPDMADLSRFLVGTMSRETAAGDGGGSAPKLDNDVVVHAVHKLLSSSAACTGGVPPAEETPLQHPDLMFSSRCPVVGGNTWPGGSDAAMARSFNSSSSWMISMTTVSSSKESLGQWSSLWRRHGPPPPHEPSLAAASQSATTSSLPKPERHES
jgi:hypothetical protein